MCEDKIFKLEINKKELQMLIWGVIAQCNFLQHLNLIEIVTDEAWKLHSNEIYKLRDKLADLL